MVLSSGLYDLAFSHRAGDPSDTAFRRTGTSPVDEDLLRLPGSLFWKMTAGMGDTVIAPLYQACSGAAFASSSSIASMMSCLRRWGRGEQIHLGRQVRSSRADDYRPSSASWRRLLSAQPLADRSTPPPTFARHHSSRTGAGPARTVSCSNAAGTSTRSSSPSRSVCQHTSRPI